MNSLSNSVRLIGRVGKIPVIENLSEDKKVARISLATVDSFINEKGEKVTDVQWHNIIAWDKTAEFAEKYLAKGTQIAIEGKLTNHNYKDKNGEKLRLTVVVVNGIMLLGSKD